MEKLKIPKASELIANSLRDKIITGEIKNGAYLPPEGQLMLDLGISRPTLREALRILESEGLIEITRGSRSGAKVLSLNINNLVKQTALFLQYNRVNILDLYEARLALEPYALEQIFEQNKIHKVKSLRPLVENLRKLVEQERYNEFPAAIANFDISLIAIAQNQTLNILSKIVLEMVVSHQNDFQNRFKQSREVLRKRYNAGYRSCTKLLDLIANNEKEQALSHWRLHLKNVAQGWTIRDENARIIDGSKF